MLTTGKQDVETHGFPFYPKGSICTDIHEIILSSEHYTHNHFFYRVLKRQHIIIPQSA